MPKVNIGTQVLDDRYRRTMAHVVVDTPTKKLCKVLGISESCWYARKRKPEDATLRELRILRRTGRITDEQILDFIREGPDK